jgi:hypothetical protein
VKRINPGKPLVLGHAMGVLQRLVRRSTEEFTPSLSRGRVRTPCWRWWGHLDKNGYGQIKVAGKAQWITRVAYQLCKRPLRAGEEVDHRCRCRNCWRPSHLRARKAVDNRADQGGPGSYAMTKEAA